MRHTPEEIEQVPVARLTANPNNARLHSDAQVAQIVHSIRQFGWTVPLLIDAEGVVIAGHARLRAAQVLELETVPCLRITHLTELEVRALMLADNRIALNATWDYQAMGDELAKLAAQGLDALKLGFSSQELTSLLMDRSRGANDPNAEWEGMPDYEKDDRVHRKIVVSFACAEDVASFAALLDQQIGPETKYLWHPFRERTKVDHQRFLSEEDEDAESLIEQTHARR